MSMPFYVAPEQVMKDRETYARKGIARGRSLIAAKCADGIVLVAENPSATLRKISEIYDRIAFAGVGRYNEFDQLRVAGVRHADLKGFSYSREDVDARSLANAYAQALGQVFTHEMKPLEVEILVAEVGHESEDDQLFQIRFDGVVFDQPTRAVLGGDAEAILERFEAEHDPTATTAEVLAVAVAALAGPDRRLAAEEIEAAILDRDGPRRTFRRLRDDEVAAVLPEPEPEPEPGAEPEPGPDAGSAPPEADVAEIDALLEDDLDDDD
jgi:proteasome alpha subunit